MSAVQEMIASAAAEVVETATAQAQEIAAEVNTQMADVTATAASAVAAASEEVAAVVEAAQDTAAEVVENVEQAVEEVKEAVAEEVAANEAAIAEAVAEDLPEDEKAEKETEASESAQVSIAAFAARSAPVVEADCLIPAAGVTTTTTITTTSTKQEFPITVMNSRVVSCTGTPVHSLEESSVILQTTPTADGSMSTTVKTIFTGDLTTPRSLMTGTLRPLKDGVLSSTTLAATAAPTPAPVPLSMPAPAVTTTTSVVSTSHPQSSVAAPAAVVTRQVVTSYTPSYPQTYSAAAPFIAPGQTESGIFMASREGAPLEGEDVASKISQITQPHVVDGHQKRRICC